MPATRQRNLATPIQDETVALAGWGTAIFPTGIDGLQQAYEQAASNLPWLDTAADQVEDFQLVGQSDNPATSGGAYTGKWQVVYTFKFPNRGEASVLFPEKGSDGQYGLHTATFVRGAGNDVREQLELLIRNFTIAIED